jgi:hypothetical protein
MKKSLFILLLIFSFDSFCLRSQPNDPFINFIKERLTSYCRSVPYEDIYIHSDRDIYIAGEYFWFNTYLLNRQSSSLSKLSSYAYVELLDPDNKPVSQIKVRLKNGTGGAGFRIPDSLSTGEYTLRAYTSWMKNFLPDGCFMKEVTVYNPFSDAPFKRIVPSKFKAGSIYSLYFFPEGGRILNGFVNKVGLRIFDKKGTGSHFYGYLSDGLNDTITKVIVDSMGIGSFEFLALHGRNYKIVSYDRKMTFPLPETDRTGYSIAVKNTANHSLSITVNNGSSTNITNNFFYLVIQYRGSILYTGRIDFEGNSTVVPVAENLLIPGINQITIFNAGGYPVCNRFVFKQFTSGENIGLAMIDTAGKSENVKIEISIDSGIISKNLLSNFSLSVSAICGKEPASDISEYSVTGDEYFSPGLNNLNNSGIFKMSPETIDNFLLSVIDNWIKWEDILQGKPPEFLYKPENEKQSLSGFYRTRNKTEPTNNKLLFLSIPGKIPLFKYAKTDNNSRFAFTISENESSKDYVIQSSEIDNGFSIEMESPFSESYPETRSIPDSTILRIPDEYEKWSINYQIGKIYGISDVGDTIKPLITGKKAIRFYGKPDQELVMSDYISLPTMQEVFFELIPGVIIKTRKSKNGIFVQDPVTRNFYDSHPALFIDGVIFDDPSAIINLDPELVEKIDIIKDEYIIGDVFLSGIISAITKAGDLSNVSLPENAIRIMDNSIAITRRFKSPAHESVSSESGRIPDFRNTLYWNHSIQPDKPGRFNIEFMTSDFVSSYEISFQGAADGKLFSAKKILRVH